MPALILDSHEDSAETLKMIFEFEGADAVTCTSPHEALGIAEKYQPEVVVFEIRLPGMNGLEAVSRICASPKISRKPYLIAYTTSNTYQREAFRDGIGLYLLKGSENPERLAKIVAAHVLHGKAMGG